MGWLRSRAAAFGLAILAASAGLAAPVWAECADYISSSWNDDPAMGTLVGTETRTESYTIELGYEGSGVSYTETVTYDVGYYRMQDGTTNQVDCRDYTLIG